MHNLTSLRQKLKHGTMLQCVFNENGIPSHEDARYIFLRWRSHMMVCKTPAGHVREFGPIKERNLTTHYNGFTVTQGSQWPLHFRILGGA